jgi:hypothetical protein
MAIGHLRPTEFYEKNHFAILAGSRHHYCRVLLLSLNEPGLA